MDRVGDRWGKMERYCSTGRSPQRPVAPTKEEEEIFLHFHSKNADNSGLNSKLILIPNESP
jgi:hypothetical protein